jgi:peroxiredoxin
MWQAYADQGVAMLGISFQDASGASRAFLQETGITYPIGVDVQGRISRSYGVTAVPETYVIDRQGRVAWVRIGEVQADALAEQVERLLSP